MAIDDFETLRVIRDKEKSVDNEIEEFQNEQKRIYDEARKDGAEKLVQRRAELDKKYSTVIENLKKDLDAKKLEIIEQGEAKATTIRLDVSDSDIENIVMKALMDYLEG